jgi:hypothetical protein
MLQSGDEMAGQGRTVDDEEEEEEKEKEKEKEDVLIFSGEEWPILIRKSVS